MSHPPDSSQFRAALKEIFTEAMKDGKSAVSVNSGILHRQVGGYPGPSHRMPICCEVMYQEMGSRDKSEASPPKGKGASLRIRYDLHKGGRSQKRTTVFRPPVQKTDLSTLTRDELVAWLRAEYEKGLASGEPRPFDAEVFTAEMRRKRRPSEQEES